VPLKTFITPHHVPHGMKGALPTLMLVAIVALSGCTTPAPAKDCEKAVSFRATLSYVDVVTDKGNFTIELNGQKSPVTVCNFLGYVEAGAYDNTIFHRLAKGFVIQGGGCDANGQFKAKLFDPIKNEAIASGLKNEARTIAMARTTDPDSATNQFFINLAHNHDLDPGGYSAAGYAVFGRVSSGWSTVEALAASPTYTPPLAQQDECHPKDGQTPNPPLRVQSVRVAPA
jgi:peptidyl-prolyl cis-trans isomerase A (cyclophilin A)